MAPSATLTSPHNLTSSRTGTLYFAYGSNLSVHQMEHRCRDAPAVSARPVAVARLDGWRWLICERGYANIAPLEEGGVSGESGEVDARLRGKAEEESVGASATVDMSRSQIDGEEREDASRVVWGILYNMTVGDERVLDGYEGHDKERNPRPEVNPDLSLRGRTPELQGDWDYNKWYIDVTVTKWLQPPSVLGLEDGNPLAGQGRDMVKVLAYVDELRTREGPISKNYVGRMNRAIEEGVAMGVPRGWVDQVMRRWVVPGIFPEHGYVGTIEGYVPETEMEATTEVV